MIDEENYRVVPVVEEELIASKRAVKTGSVRVDKHVEKRTENVTMPLVRETVEVRRVPVNRVVERMPEVRTSGDTTIIPVVEEQIVVTKQLVLVEEVHMTRRRSRREETIPVEIEKERAEVVRLDASGRIQNQEPEKPAFEFPIGHHRPVLKP